VAAGGAVGLAEVAVVVGAKLKNAFEK